MSDSRIDAITLLISHIIFYFSSIEDTGSQIQITFVTLAPVNISHRFILESQFLNQATKQTNKKPIKLFHRHCSGKKDAGL